MSKFLDYLAIFVLICPVIFLIGAAVYFCICYPKYALIAALPLVTAWSIERLTDNNMAAIPKNKRLKSKKITGSAKGQDCTVNIPDVCNYNPETTVFAHLGGAGVALKAHDIHGAYACNDCHKFLDGEYAKHGWTREQAYFEHLRSTIKTQIILIQQGLIKA